jgi:hypothetical protein
MSEENAPLIQGYIYCLLNSNNNFCYIGSTTYKYPKKRYSHHINPKCPNRNRYPELFADGNPQWLILHKGLYKSSRDLRKMEDDYINCYKTHPSLVCVNQIRAYLSEEDCKEMQKAGTRRYLKTPRGKLNKKYQNWRRKMRQQILLELKDKVPLAY